MLSRGAGGYHALVRVSSMVARRFAPALAGLALLAAGCPAPAAVDAGPTVPVYGIDAGFLFGAAVSGYQVEAGDDLSDWNVWAQVPLGQTCTTVLSCDQADRGPNFAALYPGDLAAAADAGLNAFRFSLEWERLAPARPGDAGGYDPAALAYYHALMNTALDAGLTPVVTLWSGALPDWAHQISSPQLTGQTPNDWVGGWRGLPGEDAGPDAFLVKAFGQFAGDMAREYGGQVRTWITLDLPMRRALEAYLTGAFPPGGQQRLSDLQAAVINLAYANAGAYDAIHAALPADAGVRVGTSNLFQLYVPDPASEPDAGYAAAELLGYLGNFLLPNAFLNGALAPYFVGNCATAPLIPYASCGQVGLAGRADFIGVAYAGPEVVLAGTLYDAQGNGALTWGGLASPLAANGGFDGGFTDAPLSLPIDPGDLTAMLLLVQQAYPLVPVVVTELSLNENAQPDVERPAYLVSAVSAVQAAMAQGVNVQGIFYKSLVDDYEWQYGFAPRTGLWRVDFTDPLRARTETVGAKALGAIAKAAGVTPALAAQFGR